MFQNPLIQIGKDAIIDYNKEYSVHNNVSGYLSGAAGAATGAIVGNYLGDLAAVGVLLTSVAFPALLPVAGAAMNAAPIVGTVAGVGVGIGVDTLFKKVLG